MWNRRYFVANEAVECLDGRFDDAVESIHSYDREQQANMQYAHDSTTSPGFDYGSRDFAADIVKELKESPAYDELTEDDRLSILRYANRISLDEEAEDPGCAQSAWKIVCEQPDDEGRLFPVLPTLRSIPTHSLDFALLTGWGGLDVLKASNVDVNNYEDYGCSSRLQLLQLLGALSSQRVRDVTGDYEAERYAPRGDISRRIFFGGDMHFDFYMGTAERYPNGSIDPLGYRQDFAPDKHNIKRIQSYHSVEEGLFTDLMFWAHRIAGGEFEQDQFDLFSDATVRVINKFSSRDMQKNPFSMGSAQHYETGVDSLAAAEIQEYFDNPYEHPDGSLSLIMGQLPGGLGDDSFTDVCVDKEGTLSFRTCRYSSGEKEELQRIVFDQSELVPLVEVSIEHAYRGLGRTSWIRLLSLMAMRFFPDECAPGKDQDYFERGRDMPQLALKLVLGIDPVSENKE